MRDTDDEPNETLVLRLTNPTGFMATLGSPSTAILTITDNDTAGRLQFAAASVTAAEAAGSALLRVRRLGGTAGNVTIDYATAPGTASVSDFTPASGTLTLGPGQRARRCRSRSVRTGRPREAKRKTREPRARGVR